jgi:hypothetical protein
MWDGFVVEAVDARAVARTVDMCRGHILGKHCCYDSMRQSRDSARRCAEPVPRGWLVRHHGSVIYFSYFSSLLPCVVPQIFHMLIFESQQLLDVSKKMKSNSQIVLYLVTKVVSI